METINTQNESKRIIEITFNQQKSENLSWAILDFDEFKAEVDEQISLYKSYYDELNKVYWWINSILSFEKERKRNELMTKMIEIEYKYTAILKSLDLFKNISIYKPSSILTWYVRNLVWKVFTKK